MKKSILLVAALLAPVAVAQRPPVSPEPDAYGYRAFDQTSPECALHLIDIAASGEEIVFVPSGADPALDDGGAVVPLTLPFELYGEPVSSIVVSANGYLAIAASLDAEDGGDFSNDAVLPAIPGNSPAVPARIFVYHDELSGFMSGGRAVWQHFPTCPRPSDALGDEPCTVFQWSDWRLLSGGGTFGLQAWLYHDSFEVAAQIAPGAGLPPEGTIGIQNRTATVASQYRPEATITASTTVCFFEPRFPPGGAVADLRVTMDDATEVVTPGQSLLYEIGVLNRGPSPAAGIVVSDNAPPALIGCQWTCTSSEGSLCTAAGSGSLADVVDLQPDGWADYLLTCDTSTVASTVVTTVAATLPAAVADPRPGDNAATDIDLAGAGRVYDLLRLGRAGGQIELSWGASCLASDDDYAVYSGSLGDFYAHEPVTCGTGGALELAVAPPEGDRYYLVAPRNDFSEGSHGVSSDAGERPPGASSCVVQAIGVCPI